ncbi:MAG: glycosyltransferase family A protein [Casimicrobiaceae bacterium]
MRQHVPTPDAPWFTVFTATYNRAHTLRRVYESLLLQTMQDFEWLIVDDGSTDGTEARVQEMMGEARLTIRYIKKTNGGVHTAHNVAIREANGELFLRLDSDDACVPKALETLREKWLEIPENLRDQYSGISCLCMQSSGETVGDVYPANQWDSDYVVLESLRGEKWGFHRLDLLRKHPFPEFAGERFCPEGLVWARLHDKYKTRCFNIPLRVYFNSNDSMTSSIIRMRYRSPKGMALYYNEQMYRLGIHRALRHAVNYVRFSPANGGIRQALRNATRTCLVLLALPLGWALHVRDLLRGDCA